MRFCKVRDNVKQQHDVIADYIYRTPLCELWSHDYEKLTYNWEIWSQ